MRSELESNFQIICFVFRIQTLENNIGKSVLFRCVDRGKNMNKKSNKTRREFHFS